ncbi:hypothetical protein BKI52_01330 [marine bacterium AO1-C]|nr:hypothetical protein BKI52_01330 [marine bacterium AO1-C]
MKKNNHSAVNQKNNHSSQLTVNPRGEMSQKRADLKEKATLQKEMVSNDLTKIKKDARTVLLVAGAAFVTFQAVRALTKEKKKPEPAPKPTPKPTPEEPTPVQEKQGLGQMITNWVKGQVIAYAAEKAKDLVWKYVQSRINKQQNAEERTSDTDQEKAGRD